MLDGAWGVLIQSEVRGEDAYRGERFRDHPRDVAGDPDLLNLTRPGDRLADPRRLLRRRRRHRDDEHVHGDDDRPGRLRPRGRRLRDERRRRAARPRAADAWTRAHAGQAALRRRLGRAAQRHALALAARRRRGVPRGHVRPGARRVRGTDARAARGRRGPPPDRDRLRHAERKAAIAAALEAAPEIAALALVHGRRPQRPHALGADGRGVLGSRSSTPSR